MLKSILREQHVWTSREQEKHGALGETNNRLSLECRGHAALPSDAAGN